MGKNIFNKIPDAEKTIKKEQQFVRSSFSFPVCRKACDTASDNIPYSWRSDFDNIGGEKSNTSEHP